MRASRNERQRVFRNLGHQMQDWTIVLLPLALAAYLLVFPNHLASAVIWADAIIFSH